MVCSTEKIKNLLRDKLHETLQKLKTSSARLQDFCVASCNTPSIVRNGYVSWFRGHMSITPSTAACVHVYYDWHVIVLRRVIHPSRSTVTLRKWSLWDQL